jgi:hypothetical protein
MNTIDWFVFIQQEHYFAPKCFAGPIHNGPVMKTPIS